MQTVSQMWLSHEVNTAPLSREVVVNHTLPREFCGSRTHTLAHALAKRRVIFLSLRQSKVLTLKQLNFLVHEKVIKVDKGFQAGWICRTRR